MYEKRTQLQGGTTTIRHTHYIRAGDQVIATSQRTKVGSNPVGAAVYRYLHRDHLGSVTALTDAGGALLERSGFDPWGKRTDFSTWAPPNPLQFLPGGSGAGGTTNAVTSTARGYTGHEQVDELGFIHMNGRIYDPEVGRFLSADPTMQFPESTQGFNRYAYAGNNPLSNVDPSGFSFWKKLMKIVGIIMSVWMPQLSPLFQMLWAFTSGFLASGGDVKAGFLTMALFQVNSMFGPARGAAGKKALSGATSLFEANGGSAADKGNSWGFEIAKWINAIREIVKAATEPEKKSAPDGKLANGAATIAFMASLNPLKPVAGPFTTSELVEEIELSRDLSPAEKYAALDRLTQSLTVTQTFIMNTSDQTLRLRLSSRSRYLFGDSASRVRAQIVDKMYVDIEHARLRSMRYLAESVVPTLGDTLAEGATIVAGEVVHAAWQGVNTVGTMRELVGANGNALFRGTELTVEICDGVDTCDIGEYKLWLDHPK